jgi:hypothetical protein
MDGVVGVGLRSCGLLRHNLGMVAAGRAGHHCVCPGQLRSACRGVG